MRIFIFSYIRLFVESLSVSLRQCEGISYIETCYQENQLVSPVVDCSLDVVLVDVTIKGALIESRALCEILPKMPVIAIAAPEIAEIVIECADAGLIGYVPRQASVDELHARILMALKGECICSAQITASLLQEIRSRQKLCDE